MFPLIAYWSRCLSHFRFHVLCPLIASHWEMQGLSFGRSYWSRWAKVFTYRKLVQVSFNFQFHFHAPSLHHTEILVTVGESFHLSHTGPGVFHIFDSMVHAPSSHRAGKLPLIANWSRRSFTFSIQVFLLPHRTTFFLLHISSHWKVSTNSHLVQALFKFSIKSSSISNALH